MRLERDLLRLLLAPLLLDLFLLLSLSDLLVSLLAVFLDLWPSVTLALCFSSDWFFPQAVSESSESPPSFWGDTFLRTFGIGTFSFLPKRASFIGDNLSRILEIGTSSSLPSDSLCEQKGQVMTKYCYLQSVWSMEAFPGAVSVVRIGQE